MAKIEQVRNGYILESQGSKMICVTLEEVFQTLLLQYEGLSPSFLGEGFGQVTIVRGYKDGEFEGKGGVSEL